MNQDLSMNANQLVAFLQKPTSEFTKAKSANELKNTVTNWDSSLWKEGGNGYPVFKWSK